MLTTKINYQVLKQRDVRQSKLGIKKKKRTENRLGLNKRIAQLCDKNKYLHYYLQFL